MIVGIGIMALCGGYYYLWMHVLPRWGNYTIRSQVLLVDDNGANTHKLLRVPNSELAEWDATHDELGREIRHRRPHDGSEDADIRGAEKGVLRDDQANISPTESVTKT